MRFAYRMILMLASVVLAVVPVRAQGNVAKGDGGEKERPEGPNIVEHIMSDSVSVVILEPGLEQLLWYEEPNDGPKRAGNIGYRVQVFSDSNQRTAKMEARSKQRSVASRFPQWGTYVTFASPYWRVKVGDFAKMEEAEQAAGQIRRAFPGFANEVRVVRDRISIKKQ